VHLFRYLKRNLLRYTITWIKKAAGCYFQHFVYVFPSCSEFFSLWQPTTVSEKPASRSNSCRTRLTPVWIVKFKTQKSSFVLQHWKICKFFFFSTFSKRRNKWWKQNNNFEVIYRDSTLSITKSIYQSIYPKLCVKHRIYNERTQEEE
jgi:hypothetical protein